MSMTHEERVERVAAVLRGWWKKIGPGRGDSAFTVDCVLVHFHESLDEKMVFQRSSLSTVGQVEVFMQETAIEKRVQEAASRLSFLANDDALGFMRPATYVVYTFSSNFSPWDRPERTRTTILAGKVR